MGRPLAKRFFGNTNEGGMGAEGVLSVALGTAGTLYSQGLTATVSAPQVAGGVTATVTPVVTVATGAISGYTVTKQGSGYTSAPTVTLVKPTNRTPTGTGVGTEFTVTVSSVTGISVGMGVTGTGIGASSKVASVVTATKVVTLTVANSGAVSGTLTFADGGASGVPGTVTLTTTRPNALALTALTAGSTPRTNSDIVKQTGSRRYKISNQDGTVICKLVAAVPAAIGEASLVGTDSSGKTYYITKLTAHSALITQFGTAGHEFADKTEVKWTLGAAVLNSSVTIANV